MCSVASAAPSHRKPLQLRRPPRLDDDRVGLLHAGRRVVGVPRDARHQQRLRVGLNHGFDPVTYLRAVDYARVLQVHLAGHAREPDGTLVDTHDHPVPDAVWALYAEAWALGGPFLRSWSGTTTSPRCPRCWPSSAALVRCAHDPAPRPDWLAAMQARFSAVIRTPLDRSTGTLRAVVDHYPEEASPTCATRQRGRLGAPRGVQPAVLVSSAHGDADGLPVTTALLGPWRFNAHAAAFSRRTRRAPGSSTAHRTAQRFVATLPADDLPVEALTDAATLDASWRALFRAPAAAPFRPRPEDAARILDARLTPSPGVALYVSGGPSWPCVAPARERAGRQRAPSRQSSLRPRGGFFCASRGACVSSRSSPWKPRCCPCFARCPCGRRWAGWRRRAPRPSVRPCLRARSGGWPTGSRGACASG